jgi:hypothetical protein
VHSQPTDAGPLPTILKGVFLLIGLLVLVAMGYAGWIIVKYWDQVGV